MRSDETTRRLRMMPPDLRIATRRWVRELGRQGYSRHTIYNYDLASRKFGVFLAGHGHRTQKLDERIILAWVERDRRRGLRPSSINRQVAMLRSLCQWMTRHGVIDDNPMSKLGHFREERPLPELLEKGELGRLLSQVRRIEERVLIELIYSTGCRTSEIVRLDVSDVSLGRRTLHFRNRKSEPNVLPLNPRMVRTLRRYLKFRERRQSRLGRPCPSALFLNARGIRATQHNVQDLMRVFQRKARLRTRVTGTVLRNTFAAHLMDRGADLRIIQNLMGYRWLSTACKFSRVARAPLRKVYERTHPRA